MGIKSSQETVVINAGCCWPRSGQADKRTRTERPETEVNVCEI